MYTQCPECGVAFRVTAEVLKQAAGKVRCGGCGIAFNALEHLSEKKPGTTEQAHEASAPELAPADPDAGAADGPPQTISAEQSAALLKTLDQLAGSDIRIEDTGVEWRVLDVDEDEAEDEAAATAAAEAAAEQELAASFTPIEDVITASSSDAPAAKAIEEMRFDDNTPLPEDFDFDSAPAAPAPPAASPPPEPEPEPAETQVDLAFGEPDEWEDLLGHLDEPAASDVAPAVENLEAVTAVDDPPAEATGSPRGEAEFEPAAADEVERDEPLDVDTQFALQAEAMGIDLSGLHAARNEETQAETSSADTEHVERSETTIEEDLIAAAFETEAELHASLPELEPADTDNEAELRQADVAGTEQAVDASLELEALDAELGLAEAAEAEAPETVAEDVDAALDLEPDEVEANAEDVGAAADLEPEETEAVAEDVGAAADLESDETEAVAEDIAASADLEPEETEAVAEDVDAAADLEPEEVDETPDLELEELAGADDYIDEAAEVETDAAGDEDGEPAPDGASEDVESIAIELAGDHDADEEPERKSDVDDIAAKFDDEVEALIETMAAPPDSDDDEAAEAATDDHDVPEMSEEEKTINMLIDQELLNVAVEDEDGFASTIVQVQPDKKVEKEIAASKATEKIATKKKPPPLVETIIMEGESIRAETADGDEPSQADQTGISIPIPKTPDDYMRQRQIEPSRRGMIAAIAGLGILLVLQAIHQSREALATVPFINNAIGPVYRLFGKPLTPTWNIAGWRFEATKGSTDEGDEVLTIYSRVGNESEQELPYPLVHVSLTDRFEEIIGSRVLEPSEYLAEDADPRETVPPGNTFNAVISIAAPAPEATGFKLNVCYRLATGQLRCEIEDFK